jgi:hypothetical protein
MWRRWICLLLASSATTPAHAPTTCCMCWESLQRVETGRGVGRRALQEQPSISPRSSGALFPVTICAFLCVFLCAFPVA